MFPKFKVKILSLDGKKYEDEVEALYFEVPEKGLTGILANHLEYSTMLFIGIIYVIKNNEKKYFAVSGGQLRFKDNLATILVDTFESADEIDEERQRRIIARSEEIMNEVPATSVEYDNAVFNLRKATNRLRLLK